MKASENGLNEEDEAKDEVWKNKTAEILFLMKEMTGRTSEQKLKNNLETVEQEVSQFQGNWKKIDEETEEQIVSASHNFGTVEREVSPSQGIKRKTDEAQETVGQHHLSGSQRSKKKNEAKGESEEKIKKKKVRRDEGQRPTEKEDERKRRKAQNRAKKRRSEQGSL